MPETNYRQRHAVQLENEYVRITVLVEGGHIAEILDKASGVNPLWTPPWPTMEPSEWTADRHPEYGNDAESRLLAGIMGHNVCLDLFGGPSPEEAAAGITVHGEASLLPYDITDNGDSLQCTCYMAKSQIQFHRTIRLSGKRVLIQEAVENLSPFDRPIAWQQHVTLGPPFLERGKTRFDVTASVSRTYEGDFGNLFQPGVDFLWPDAPTRDGRGYDLRVFTDRESSAGYTAHLMDRIGDTAEWSAVSADGLRFGYRWRRSDFPWLGIWEENHFRKGAPWNGHTMTRGMEFGASPQPETRRAMIDRHRMFETPVYKWLPARTTLTAEYEAFFG